MLVSVVFLLGMIPCQTWAQKPTVSLALDKTVLTEAGGKATLTATLSAPHSQDVTIFLKMAGTAAYHDDFDLNFVGKGFIKTVAGGNGRGSAADQLFWPNGIFVDSLGNLFIVDSHNERIQKWAPGSTSGVTVAGGNGKGSAANQLDNPSSIFVDSLGSLFIVDTGNHRVQKWESGATSGVTVAGGNGTGSAANQLYYPSDIFVDSHGSVFVIDYGNHRVQKWVYNAMVGVTVAGENGLGLRANQLYYPEGILVDNRGNIIISTSPSRIQKWVPGATSSVIMADKNWIRLGGNKMYYHFRKNAFFDKNGYLFYAEIFNDHVLKVNYQPQIVIPAGQTSAMLTLTVLDDKRFEDNEGVTFEVDKIENAVLHSTQSSLQATILDNDIAPRVSLSFSDSTLLEDGSAIDLQLQLSAGAGKFTKVQLDFLGTAVRGTHYTVVRQEVIFEPGDSVAHVRLTPMDNSLVEPPKTIAAAVIGGENVALPYSVATIPLSSDDKPEVVLNLDRTILSEAGGKAKVTASLSAPHSRDVFVYFKPSGTAKYIEDYSLDIAGKIHVKTVAGGNGQGSGPNQFTYLTGIFVDHQGNIFLADEFNMRIQKWAPDAISGITVAAGDEVGFGFNQNLMGIFVDHHDNLFIADRENSRIQKWVPGASSGVTVAGGNGVGSAANQLAFPTGVFVDSLGNLFIVDTLNDRVQKWIPGASEGVTVAGGNGKGPAADQLDSPTFIFVDSQGNLYISDSRNNRIQKWRPGATSGVTVAGGNGEGLDANQLFYPTQVFLDRQNNLYIFDKYNHRIQKWAPGASSGVTVAGRHGFEAGSKQLEYSTGIFVDGEGNLHIVDRFNYRIQKVVFQPHLKIPAGQTSASFIITTPDDSIREEDKVALFEISSIENANLSPNQLDLKLLFSNQNSSGPIIRARDSIRVFLNTKGTVSLEVEAIELGSTDSIGIASRALSIFSFDCGQVGVVPVEYRVTNLNGNVRKKVILVTVADTISPIVQTQKVRLAIGEDGRAVLNIADLIASSSDNCGVATQKISTTSFGCSQIGNQEVNVTVTDVNNNKTEVKEWVEIVDSNGVCPCSYSILAKESVKLVNNRLRSGGVGTFAANQLVRLDNTRIQKETVFIRSTQIETDETSRTDRLVKLQAPQPFTFEQRKTSSSDMRVKNNQDKISSTSQFRVIRVNRGGKLTLTSSEIAAKRIIIEKGGQLNVNQKSIIGVEGRFKTESNVVINSTNESLRVYVGEALVIGSNNSLNGYFYTLQEAALKRNRGTDTTRVRGTVVGNTVVAMDQVVWESGVKDCSGENSDNKQGIIPKAEYMAAQQSDDEVEGWGNASMLKEGESKLFLFGPNPTNTHVFLSFYEIPSVKPIVQIFRSSIHQVDGMVKQIWLSDHTLNLDLNELPMGVYLISVRVDDKVQTVKLVKE